MMKKKGMGTVVSILLTAAMLLGGCGSAAETQTPAEETKKETVQQEVKESAAEESQSEAQATAESLIGEDVQTLIDAIGEPESTAYQDSCAVADAQDGFWTYDGFTVVTLKTAEGETVQDIQ